MENKQVVCLKKNYKLIILFLFLSITGGIIYIGYSYWKSLDYYLVSQHIKLLDITKRDTEFIFHSPIAHVYSFVIRNPKNQKFKGIMEVSEIKDKKIKFRIYFSSDKRISHFEKKNHTFLIVRFSNTKFKSWYNNIVYLIEENKDYKIRIKIQDNISLKDISLWLYLGTYQKNKAKNLKLTKIQEL